MNVLLDWLEYTAAVQLVRLELWWLVIDAEASRKLYLRTLSPAHHKQYKHDKSRLLDAENRLQDLLRNRKSIYSDI